jgi:hypothetical protein
MWITNVNTFLKGGCPPDSARTSGRAGLFTPIARYATIGADFRIGAEPAERVK